MKMTMRTLVTAITRAQIKALRAEAEAAGNQAQVEICDRALSSAPVATISILVDGEIFHVEEDARELCVDALNLNR